MTVRVQGKDDELYLLLRRLVHKLNVCRFGDRNLLIPVLEHNPKFLSDFFSLRGKER